jgi:hypothetical protein
VQANIAALVFKTTSQHVSFAGMSETSRTQRARHGPEEIEPEEEIQVSSLVVAASPVVVQTQEERLRYLENQLPNTQMRITLLMEFFKAGLEKAAEEENAPLPTMNGSPDKAIDKDKDKVKYFTWSMFIAVLVAACVTYIISYYRVELWNVVCTGFMWCANATVTQAWTFMKGLYNAAMQYWRGPAPAIEIPAPEEYKRVLYFLLSLGIAVATGYNAYCNGGAGGPPPPAANAAVNHFMEQGH